MILNNCTTCGRKPNIRKHKFWFSLEFNHYAHCECSKMVQPSGENIWTEEVAADMWNRANPVESEIKSDYINYLAEQAVKLGLKPVFSEFGEFHFIPTQYISVMHRDLMIEFTRHKIELWDFYKNRLQTEARA